jgi:hypothetical protein
MQNRHWLKMRSGRCSGILTAARSSTTTRRQVAQCTDLTLYYTCGLEKVVMHVMILQPHGLLGGSLLGTCNISHNAGSVTIVFFLMLWFFDHTGTPDN